MSSEEQVRQRDTGSVAARPHVSGGFLYILTVWGGSSAAFLFGAFYLIGLFVPGEEKAFAFKILAVPTAIVVGLLAWVWLSLWLFPKHVRIEAPDSFVNAQLWLVARVSPLGHDEFTSRYANRLTQAAINSPAGPDEFMRRHYEKLFTDAIASPLGRDEFMRRHFTEWVEGSMTKERRDG